MKPFPYRILFISIFLPPVCYILTLQGLEAYLGRHVTYEINKRLIQNDQALYEGLIPIRDEINHNIGEYLAQNLMFRIGVRLNILIKTGDNRILYPTHMNQNINSTDYSDQFTPSLNSLDIAKDNYDIMTSGIIPSIDLKIMHNSWISNSILILYVFISVYILQNLMRKRIHESEKYEQDQRHLIENLTAELIRAESILKETRLKESEYQQKIDRLDRDKHELNQDIEGLLEEMESLEGGLKSQRVLREKTEENVLILTAEIEQLKEKSKKGRKKNKKLDALDKRFKVLYKNLSITERAVQGFSSLTDDFQLKAEEIIHKLNEDDSLVNVKRKVFSKGGKINVLEVEFAYSGRLYFRKESSGKCSVLIIGTKNTQEQDLNHLEGIEE